MGGRNASIVAAALSAVVVLPPALAEADPGSPPLPPSPYELSARGRRVRGLFLPTPHLAVRGPERIARSARAAGLEALVMDVKDERGRVLFATNVPALRSSRVVVHRDLAEMVGALQAQGHWVIARVVCFKDDTLAEARPDLAVRDSRTGEVWRSRSRNQWLDPGNPTVVQTLVALSREVEALGFDEIQYDYVRYPVDRNAEHAEFPSDDGTPRRRVISRFLAAANAALSIPISVDVFGLTVFRDGDPAGLGQSIEDMVPHVDVISPMLYASDFGDGYIRTRREHPIAGIVWKAVRTARRRLGHHVAIRPYLQAFRFRAPGYGTDFMRAQILAARSAGADGYLFWNPGCAYSTVFRTLAGMGPLR